MAAAAAAAAAAVVVVVVEAVPCTHTWRGRHAIHSKHSHSQRAAANPDSALDCPGRARPLCLPHARRPHHTATATATAIDAGGAATARTPRKT